MYVRLYFEVTSTCILHCISHASISKLHAGVFYTVFCLTSSAKRNRSCTITMVEEAKWKSVTEGVGQLLSMKEGVAIIKAFDQGADGKWKWAKQPGVFILQEKGDHGSLLSPFKRSNSVLTWGLRARSRSPRTLYLNSRMVTPMSEHMGYDTFLKGNCT